MKVAQVAYGGSSLLTHLELLHVGPRAGARGLGAVGEGCALVLPYPGPLLEDTAHGGLEGQVTDIGPEAHVIREDLRPYTVQHAAPLVTGRQYVYAPIRSGGGRARTDLQVVAEVADVLP